MKNQFNNSGDIEIMATGDIPDMACSGEIPTMGVLSGVMNDCGFVGEIGIGG